MTTVGSYEAKTHLPQLLVRANRGEKIVITRRGKPVAMLVAPETERPIAGQVVKEMLECRDREGPVLGEDLSVRDLIDAGRRS